MVKVIATFCICLAAFGVLGYMHGTDARYRPDKVIRKAAENIELKPEGGGYIIEVRAGPHKWTWDVQKNQPYFDDPLVGLEFKERSSFPVSTHAFSEWVEPKTIVPGLPAILLYLQSGNTFGSKGLYYVAVFLGAASGYSFFYFMNERREPDPGSSRFRKALADTAANRYVERVVFLDLKKKREKAVSAVLDSLRKAGEPNEAAFIEKSLAASETRAKAMEDLGYEDFHRLLQPLAFVSGPAAPKGAGNIRGVLSAETVKSLQGSGILP